MIRLRRYLIAGLLVWVPLGVTVLVIKLLVDLMDRTLVLLPPPWRPEELFGFGIPGLGILVGFVVILVTGMIAANLVGRQVVAAWESLLARIPLVRSIYSAAKQVVESIVSADSNSFRKVLLVEYPRKGIWSLAFQTGEIGGEVQDKTIEDVVTVFVPTTPNPTSGFIVFIARSEIIELEMSVEDGMKLVMSLGVVAPKPPGKAAEVAEVAEVQART